MRLNSKNIKGNIIYLIFLLIFTFFVSEIAYIYILNINQNKEKISLQDKKDVLRRNANKKYKFRRTIFGMKPDLNEEFLDLKTDMIGAISPSDLNSLEVKDKYILFCGGSTTESSYVPEGKRTIDLFNKKNTKYKAINLGKAGRGLNECIEIIQLFNNEILKKEQPLMQPSYYVISTNFNTLSDFLRIKFSENHKNNSKIKFFGNNILSLSFNKFKIFKRNKKLGINLSNYENAVLDGCCFSPSNINNPKYLPKLVSWDSLSLTNEYKKYLNNQIISLNKVQDKFDISNTKIVFFIEPNSFEIDYKNLFRPYWKGLDGRQKLFNFNGEELSNSESSRIVKVFDDIYSKEIKNLRYQILYIDPIVFPKWSFYDAVHYTENGTDFLSDFFVEFFNNDKN